MTTMGTCHHGVSDEAALLAATIERVVERWSAPPAGSLISDAVDFRRQWNAAAELGWTSILDEVDCTSAVSLAESAGLVELAASAVRALARCGVTLPLRQTLTARALAASMLPADAIAVCTHAYGVWEPIADVVVDAEADPASGAVRGDDWQCVPDLAGRPTRPHPASAAGRSFGGRELSAILLTAEIAGAADGAIDMTRTYVSDRVQFGRPLINIPAVGTALGELEVGRVRLDRALHEVLARIPRAEPNRLMFAIDSARAVAAEVASVTVRQAHQLHGALGVTEESGLFRRTLMLWADRDEGREPTAVGVMPSTEYELWALTSPEEAG